MINTWKNRFTKRNGKGGQEQRGGGGTVKALTESPGGVPAGVTFRRIGMMRTLSEEEHPMIKTTEGETLVPYVKIYGNEGEGGRESDG